MPKKTGIYDPKYILVWVSGEDAPPEMKSGMTSMDIFDFVRDNGISRYDYMVLEGTVVKSFESNFAFNGRKHP